MWFKTLVGRIVTICIGITAGLIIGIISLGPAFSSPSGAPHYPKNLNGQTYGSNTQATSIETEPDLILAIGVDGTEGYIKSVDLNGTMPKTPEEALKLQSKAPDFRIIPLYAVDGKTVIGKFKIHKGYPKEIKSTD